MTRKLISDTRYSYLLLLKVWEICPVLNALAKMCELIKFFAILAKNDSPENCETLTCKYRKNSNNKFSKFLDLERDKAKKIARLARLTNLKKNYAWKEKRPRS